MNGFGNSNFFTAVIFTFTDVFILARDNINSSKSAKNKFLRICNFAFHV